METVEINYEPRAYFGPFHDRTERFACIVAHRGAGKTLACVHDLVRAALEHSGAEYAYIAPTYAQAKASAWRYLREATGPLLEYGANIHNTELRVNFPNGSQVRLFGADNYDALRGMHLAGAVLDEFADFDPRAWPEVIRPALGVRRGMATFIGTPRGHNSFHEIYERSKTDPDWFSACLRASDLVPENDKNPDAAARGLLTSDELNRARRDQSPEQYEQEYECSFEAAIIGAIYGKEMAKAEADERITKVPHDPVYQSFTAWDIGGNRDATAIWVFQQIGRQICIVDFYQAIGADSAPHAQWVLDKGYNYAQHFVPHDAGPDRIGINKNYSDFLADHGLRHITVLPAPGNRENGINTARLLLPRCVFDREHCATGIEALKLYRRDYDTKNKTLKAEPMHDWTSHAADAFRYLAVALDKHVSRPQFHRKLKYPEMGVI